VTTIGREIIDSERDEFHETVEPKDAATLIIVDRSEAESKVLLGRRHKRHVFLPGKFVFPGGRVDPADRTMPVAKPVHAETERKLLVGSRLHAGHEARALALAAIRETFEETGIVVGAKAQVAGSWDAYLLFVRFTRATGSSTAIAKFCSTDGSTLRLLTDVADFHFSDIPVRGDDGARAVWATDDDDVGGRRRGATYGVIDNDRQKFRSTDMGYSRSSSLSIDSRVRGPRRHERGRSAARPARAAWSALRLLTDVDRCRRFRFRRFRFGANDGARAFGAIDHAAAAGRDLFFVISGSGRWRW
jgi:8-oxo-dGTP pyrophosphatase MutT (NUDIX family)